MTKKEFTINYIKGLKSGTTFNRREWNHLSGQIYRKSGRENGLLYFDEVLGNAEVFGVERVVTYREATSSKYSVHDVLDLIEQGHSVDEVREMLRSQVRLVTMRVL